MILRVLTSRMVRRRMPPHRGFIEGEPPATVEEDPCSMGVEGAPPSVRSNPFLEPPLYSLLLVKLRVESFENLGAR